MAIVRAGGRPLLMDNLGLSVDGDVSYSPTNVRVTFDADDYVDFGGSYSFGPQGQLQGTVTTVTNTERGKTDFTVTGANAEANTLFGLIDSGNQLAAVGYVLRDNDSVIGSRRDDRLFGFDGNDTLKGGIGLDALFGGSGNDRLFGGDDADTLVGGAGADRLYGEAGGDTFRFLATSDSTVEKAGRDTIYSFDAAEGDKIDLSQIDAIVGNDSPDDAFTLTNRFHDVAGELIVKAFHGGGFFVMGDTDGINGADFSIFVDTNVKPVQNDFQL